MEQADAWLKASAEEVYKEIVVSGLEPAGLPN